MKSIKTNILTINSGSSSIKFSLYKDSGILTQLFYGEMEKVGDNTAILYMTDSLTNHKTTVNIDPYDHDAAGNFLIDWLEKMEGFNSVKVIGHRVVHGMKHTESKIITSALISELKSLSSFDPDHLPDEIKLIEIFMKRYPGWSQVACFDTSFHADMPHVAKLLSIPRRYNAMGIQRYGFHGLSYAYLMEELNRIAGAEIAQGKIILAHLGNGASLAAVRDGKSMDTSMGFTPTSGLPMGTRSGDLDPGVAEYLMRVENYTPAEFNHLVNQESGLLGVSETSSDMRELLKTKNSDNRAADAVDLFCYQSSKWIGSFAAVLNGLETLVFSGGIGQHAPEVRCQICDSLGFLGLELDEIRNMNNEAIISTDKSKVIVRVIPTNEELIIATLACNILNAAIKK